MTKLFLDLGICRTILDGTAVVEWLENGTRQTIFLQQRELYLAISSG